jgi:Tfp pilus assembly protein PilX
MMRTAARKNGSVLLLTVFITALLSALVMGMLQVNVEEIQIMHNQLRAAEALAVAEAGLNDALAQLRADADWDAGFTKKPFSGGTYTVTYRGSRITSVGTSSDGYVADVEAKVTVSETGPPHVVVIDRFKVNE